MFVLSGNKDLRVHIKLSRQSGGAGRVWDGGNYW